MEAIRELIERLEKATGPDRICDLYLMFAMEPRRADHDGGTEPLPHRVERAEGGFWLYDAAGRRGLWGDHVVPAYTASLDAAVALVEGVLPGAWYVIGKGKTTSAEGLYGAHIMFGSDEVMGAGEHDATPAIALVLATLRARLEEHREGGE